MAIILHIDTAVETASVCLAENEAVIGFELNEIQKEHSSWLHPAINRIFEYAGKKISDTNAVAVTTGPGSYTGLRVGMAAAKGICFSLGLPLIGINTLELMAGNVITSERSADFIVPVIDARRMEVFTAVFDKTLKEVEKPHALIIDENSFPELLGKGSVIFTGNAVQKLKKVIRHDNVLFIDGMPTAKAMTAPAFRRFRKNDFNDIAYTEPLYVKEFYQARH
ncbi:MAG: tRNA (adenosine(37)-N6)-threonylcarbamoyltransferase complex dimerization subunit type 1 TsaB [Chitinophagaceae bacterium]